MTSLRSRRLPAALSLGLSGVGICSLLAIAGLSPAQAAEPSTHALAAGSPVVLAAPQAGFEDLLTDEAGALSPSEAEALRSTLSSRVAETHRPLYIVFLQDTGGISAEQWARQAGQALRSDEAAVLAIVPSTRDGGIWTGSGWPSGSEKRIWDAAYPHLAASEWAQAATAAAEASASSSSQSAGKILGVGAGVAVPVLVLGVGGGVLLARRSRKKKQEALLADARGLDPADLRSISMLPTETLRSRAEEELTSTDLSVRRAREELDRAQEEFGAERTRPFIRALNHSTTTLQRAFHLREQLYDAIPETEEEQRRILAEIISSCGQADQALDEESENFAALRRELIEAPHTIDALFARTVEAHRRLDAAKGILSGLHERHPAELLRSLEDNPATAKEALSRAESVLNEARAVSDKPAGQQRSLVDMIHEVDEALAVTDAQLRAIENADDDLRRATAHLGDLRTEIDGEIAEARQLAESGRQHGAPADWDALDSLLQEAESELSSTAEEAKNDPLGVYSRLTALDARLDDALDRVRAITTDQERRLALHSQATDSAQALIRQAEDLLASRGPLIGTEARTRLREAQRLLAESLTLRTQDTAAATAKATEAGNTARRAFTLMQSAVEEYERSQRTPDVSGAIVAGMVANALLQGGRGGFGRGFGGGGGFGGGFGGGGGSSTGGRF